MTNKLIITLILFLNLFLGFGAFAKSQKPISTINPAEYQNVTIQEVVTNPKKYDGKKVSFDGEVTEYKYTRSSKGEPFTLFKLADSDNNEVRVYYEDEHLAISEGDKLKIMGRYRKHKRYLLFKIKNVIKASTVEIL